MGGSSKKVTVGYKYYLGMHMVLCHGPIDQVKAIRIDGRSAWSGFSTGGRITIDKPGLFGGEDREGGVSGSVDIEMGRSDQLPNSYLQGRLGQDIPAFRGVVSAILRQVYMGMNPYLKPWAFRAQRVYAQTDGSEQWYPLKAPIGQYSDMALYLALDVSGSMNYGSVEGVDATTEPSRLDIAKQAIGEVLDELAPVAANFELDIIVVAWSTNTVGSITRRGLNAQGAQDIKNWVNGLSVSGGTNFGAAVTQVGTFFAGSGDKPRTVVFITDGFPNPENSVGPASNTLFSTPDLRSFGINIILEDTSFTAQMDNTPEDGVPVVTIENSSPLRDAILNTLSSHVDMNPAHIIRECLTDSTWGMGYLDADIDDTSFMLCADALYDERMGISLLWDRQIPIEEFVSEIVRHINATLYVDRVTGKFTLKLIRADYDIETTPVLDESNITSVSDYSRVDPGDAVNSVSVVYWDQRTGENASVTADDPALIQAYGAVVNTTIQYPGFTNASLAARAAARDLRTLSSPLLSCTIEATRAAAELNIGDVFKLVWPKYHDGYIVMRVHQISFGDGKKNRVKIKASEDVFALPTTSLLGEEESGWVEPGGPPLPPPLQIVTEAPYLELVQEMGQAQIDNLLVDAPELGYLQVSATRPENGLNGQLWVDDGSGFSDGGLLDFAPSCVLTTAIGKTDTVLEIGSPQDLDEVPIGTHAQIGEELIRIDEIDLAAGTLTVGRAILDTIPGKHSPGTVIVFWDLYAITNGVEYTSGETLDARVLTNTSQGTLGLSGGVTGSVTLDQRAFRPFRPANLKVANDLDPDPNWNPDYPVTITWSSRNRVQETGGVPLSWTDASVTPEAGTDYELIIESVDGGNNVVGVVTTLTQAGTSYQLGQATVGATWAQYPFIRVTIYSRRDGLRSWKGAVTQFRAPFREPYNLVAAYKAATAPTGLKAFVTV